MSAKDVLTKRGRLLAAAKRHIESVRPEVGTRMAEKFAQPGAPESGSNLDQCGLQSGIGIVQGYLNNGEEGIALEHLCYVVFEGELSLTPEAYQEIAAAGQIMQMEPNLWGKFKRE